MNLEWVTLRKKYLYSEFFWSVFSGIRTKYGDLLRKSPYLVQISKNMDQNADIQTYLVRIQTYLVRMRENTNRKTPNANPFHDIIFDFGIYVPFG